LPGGGGSLWCRAGDRRSRRVEARQADILAVWEERKDISLEELRQVLIGVGLHVSVAGLHRFFVRRGITRKKRLASPSTDGLPAWPPQNDHIIGGPAHDRHGRADGAGWSDQRRLVRSLCHPGARVRTEAR